VDINCAVCREPWDSYGVNHGDMMPWESALFMQGAGCPSCEGEGDDPETLEAHVRQRVINVPFDDDVTGGTELFDAARPRWERPEPKVIEGCTCEGCGVSVAIDPDDNLPIWHGGERVHYSGAGTSAHAYGQSYYTDRNAEDAEDHSNLAEWLKIAGEPYCPGCAELCDECGEVVIYSRGELQDDAYSEGAAFSRPGRGYYSSASVCGGCIDACERQEEEDTRDAVIYDAIRNLPDDLREAVEDMDDGDALAAHVMADLECYGNARWEHTSEGAWLRFDAVDFARKVSEALDGTPPADL